VGLHRKLNFPSETVVHDEGFRYESLIVTDGDVRMERFVNAKLVSSEGSFGNLQPLTDGSTSQL